MSMIENHLAGALREVADEIPADGVPPLHLPTAAARPRRGSRLARQRWLAPAGAAVSVAAIALAAGLLASTTGRTGAPAGSTRAVPAYYIAQTGTRTPYPEHQLVAGIYATATGARLATVSPPSKKLSVIQVSAAADDRTFAIAVQAKPGRTAQDDLPPVSFDLATFDPAASSAHRTSIPGVRVPNGATFDAFALSPDGTRLAVAYEPNKHAPRLSEELMIVDLRTLAVRTWTSSDGDVAGDTMAPGVMSWAADNKTLALNWDGVSKADPGSGLLPTSGLRLLNTAGQGGDIVADSRLVLPVHTMLGARATTGGYLSDVAVLTPDGRTVAAAIDSSRDIVNGDGWFAEYSVATGRLTERLDRGSMSKILEFGPMDVLWASPSGRVLIVYAPPGYLNQIGILQSGHLTLLPQSKAISLPACAW